jgi:hypothetical protein
LVLCAKLYCCVATTVSSSSLEKSVANSNIRRKQGHFAGSGNRKHHAME